MQFPHPITPEIQGIVKELQILGTLHPLDSNNVGRAKLLMAALKLQGFTNNDINILSRGTWSVPTIKLYTRGVSSKNKGIPNSKYPIANILLQIIYNKITIEDIQDAITLKREVESHSSSLDDIFNIITEAKKCEMRIRQVLGIYYNLNAVGLAIDDVPTLIELKHDLDEYKVSPREMRKILTDKLDSNLKSNKSSSHITGSSDFDS
ncbi:MAG TPA: hypothetical protein VGQ03_04135 [Nitrososphaera sp.]|nr:hypothetical protein [Nitrososphaera sp.]